MQRGVLWTVKEDVRTGMQAVRACWAVCVQVWVETRSVFAGGCMVGDGVGHATEHVDVVCG